MLGIVIGLIEKIIIFRSAMRLKAEGAGCKAQGIGYKIYALRKNSIKLKFKISLKGITFAYKEAVYFEIG